MGPEPPTGDTEQLSKLIRELAGELPEAYQWLIEFLKGLLALPDYLYNVAITQLQMLMDQTPDFPCKLLIVRILMLLLRMRPLPSPGPPPVATPPVPPSPPPAPPVTLPPAPAVPAAGGWLAGLGETLGALGLGVLPAASLFFGGILLPASRLGSIGFQWKSPCDELFEYILARFAAHQSLRMALPNWSGSSAQSMYEDAQELITLCTLFLNRCPDHKGKATIEALRSILHGWAQEYWDKI